MPLSNQELEQIRLAGDNKLTELKKCPNHITTQLNKDEVISYNTGFHKGYREGATEEREAAKPLVKLIELLSIEFHKDGRIGNAIHEALTNYNKK